MLILYDGSESIGGNEFDGGGGVVGGGDVYSGRAKPMLVLLSDSYSEDKEISVCDSGLSSSLAYTITDYFYQLATALRKR